MQPKFSAHTLGPAEIQALRRVDTHRFVSDALSPKVSNHVGLGQKYAMKLLHSHAFNHTVCTVIVANLFVMIVEIDRSTIDEHASSSKLHWTDIFSWTALCLFVVELSVRLIGLRSLFWRDRWNVFDFLVVSVDVVLSFLGFVVGSSFPVSILRMFRLVKLAKVSKMLRVFPELRLLLAALVGSISAIFWGACLLAFVLLMWAMVAVLFVNPFNKEVEYVDCERWSRAYSSVFQALLTIWQMVVIADGWGDLAIPLMEMRPSTLFFFVPMFITSAMAIMNLILGVVVNVAMEAKDHLLLEDHSKHILEKFEKESKILDLCAHMDSSHSGHLSRDDLLAGFQEPGEFRDCMLALDITEEDFDIIWTLMDSNNRGSVSYKEFVNSLSTLRGSSEQFMLSYIKYYMHMLKTTLLQQMQRNHTEAMSVEQEVEKEIQDLSTKEDIILEAVTDAGLISRGDGQHLVEGFERHLGNEQTQLTRLEDITVSLKPQPPAGSEIFQNRILFPDRPLPVPSDNFTLDASFDLASASTGEEAEVWLTQICGEITRVLRVELHQVLTDMKSKLCEGPSCASEKNLKRTSSSGPISKTSSKLGRSLLAL